MSESANESVNEQPTPGESPSRRFVLKVYIYFDLTAELNAAVYFKFL